LKAKELGILIDKQAYSESSIVLHFYTLERGFQSFVFKGALKKRKALNQLGLYEISYFKRPESDLGIINQLDFAWTPLALFERPQKVMLVFFMTDILQQTLRYQGADPQLFYFIRDQLLRLETNDQLRDFPGTFLAQYLMILGYTPLIDEEGYSVFDMNTGRFSHALGDNSSCIQDKTMLHYLVAQFWPQDELQFSGLVHKEGLRVLIQYASIHLANFNIDKTLEILHDTLYD
jgi:DNA repair protein RecO